MQLQIESRHVYLTDALEDYVARRVGFAFNRVAHRITDIVVRLANINGPRGGEDKSCQVQVRLNRGRTVVLEGRDASAYRAIDRTLSRAKRTVREELRRRRDRRRTM